MNKQNVKTILKETKDIYNAIASDFSTTRGKWWTGIDDFKNYTKDGDSILDLGCGNGRMADVFKDLRIKYLGVDNSAELIKIAQNRFAGQNQIKFQVGDITDLISSLSSRAKSRYPQRDEVEGSLKIKRDSSIPLRSSRNDNVENNFDLVLVIAVLHHLPTKKLRLLALKNIYQVMKPGGTLIMYNWNLWQLGYAKKYWPKLLNYFDKIPKGIWSPRDAFIPWKPLGNQNQRYVHSFTKREMKKLLKKAGFKIEQINYENQGRPTTFWNGFNLTVIAKK